MTYRNSIATPMRWNERVASIKYVARFIVAITKLYVANPIAFPRMLTSSRAPGYLKTMERHNIPLDTFKFDPSIIKNRWLLLAAGKFDPEAAAGAAPGAVLPYNAMTISWGSTGQIWNKLFFQVVVRPTRHTYGFMESGDSFTLSVFPEALKPALSLLGSKSGRDGDKIAASGLHPMASSRVAAPSFVEAELVVECRKMYWQDLDPSHFLDPAIESNYPKKDYHRVYFGEILAVQGTDAYR
jgi:flavin reductase (DIM6/NTAB) family NADH-FMN oxidoreductase RutF